MNTTTGHNVSKTKTWAGRIMTGFVALVLVATAILKIAHVPMMVDGLTKAGFPNGAILPIAILELSCLALYLTPRTSVLGMFLLTGYFGGATVTHIVSGEAFVPPLIFGLIIWGGAYFRVPELQDLLPLRKSRNLDYAHGGPSERRPRLVDVIQN
jgi:hypothetical protein